jgi:multicomponent Na+:H+ antiporter subunit F
MSLPIIVGIYVIIPALSVAAIITLIRLVRGPTLPDRVVALDLIVTLGLTIFATYGLINNQPGFLDVAIVVGLLGFLGTVAFAYFIERRI